MTTNTRTSASSPVSSRATHTEVMTSIAPAPPKTISEEIRVVARRALEASGDRTHYEYQDDKFAMKYVEDASRKNNTHVERTNDVATSESGTGVLTLMADNFSSTDPVDRDPILNAKIEILWKLLDPSLNLSHEVARSNPAVSEYMQERVRVRLEEILEQKVLQNPPTGLDLAMIAYERPVFVEGEQQFDANGNPETRSAADPVGWARRLLYGSLGATTKRVFHNEQAQLAHFGDEDGPGTVESRDLSIYRQVMKMDLPDSAEDQYIAESSRLEIEAPRADHSGDEPDDMESWVEAAHGTRGAERKRVDAAAIRNLVGFPEVTLPSTNRRRRAALRLVQSDSTVAMRSAKAFHDLAEGEPTWDQRSIEDDLLGLWTEFTSAQIGHLLGMGERVPNLLAEAALRQDSRPGRDVIKRARGALRMAAQGTEWNALADAALDSYIAEHYAPKHEWDNRTNTNEAAIAQEETAAQWAELASRIIAWPSKPAGRKCTTVELLAVWFETALS